MTTRNLIKIVIDAISPIMDILQNSFSRSIVISFDDMDVYEYNIKQLSPYRLSSDKMISFVACKCLEYSMKFQSVCLLYCNDVSELIELPPVGKEASSVLLGNMMALCTGLAHSVSSGENVSFACLDFPADCGIQFESDVNCSVEFMHTWGFEVVVPVYAKDAIVKIKLDNVSFDYRIPYTDGVWNEYDVEFTSRGPQIYARDTISHIVNCITKQTARTTDVISMYLSKMCKLISKEGRELTTKEISIVNNKNQSSILARILEEKLHYFLPGTAEDFAEKIAFRLFEHHDAEWFYSETKKLAINTTRYLSLYMNAKEGKNLIPFSIPTDEISSFDNRIIAFNRLLLEDVTIDATLYAVNKSPNGYVNNMERTDSLGILERFIPTINKILDLPLMKRSEF